MRAGLVKLGDDVRDRFTDPGHFGQTAFGDQRLERDRNGGKASCRTRVGLRPVGIAAA
jgi:hypothetical protein